MIKYPVTLDKLSFSQYVADEIFVDFIKEELNRNRLYAGIDIKVLKNLKLDIFYLWQASKSNGNWKDNNVLGTKLKLDY